MSIFSAFTKQHSYSAAPHGPLTFEFCRKAAEEYLVDCQSLPKNVFTDYTVGVRHSLVP